MIINNLYDHSNQQMLADKKIGSTRQILLFNIVAFVFLFVGYFLTTGTKMTDSDGVKVAYRFVALGLFFRNAIFGRAIQVKFVLALSLLLMSLVLSQSLIVVNIMFLLLISMSLYRLSGKEVAIALLVPTAIIVLLHVVLLLTGQLVVLSTDFGERTRSTLGFTNANQVSAIYLSFALLALFAYQQFRTKESLLLVVISFVAGFMVVWSTDSRTTMFALFFLLLLQLLEFLFHRFKIYRVSLRYFAVASPFIASAATYYLTTSKNPELDVLLSLRPYFFSEFMSQAKTLDLFVGWSTLENAGVDNLFLMLLSGVGAIGFLLIIPGISYRIFRMNSKFISITIVMMSVSVSESFLLRPEIPISAFFIHLLLSRQLQQRQNKSN